MSEEWKGVVVDRGVGFTQCERERERERDGGEVSEKERNREDRQTHIYGEEVGVVVVHKIWKRCE